ncbi:hypothetical protein [Streptomyces sp. YU58]|uniref:hypothetical protein n=1 Tax=Streptomyces sp. SX92 TaxID=3158972 RepID=UPI0027BA81A9|nr:hypothetical protein [Streptomyces coralus]WLW52473.1 hypothetical protein QU709_14260 [Streptomyces coralus]
MTGIEIAGSASSDSSIDYDTEFRSIADSLRSDMGIGWPGGSSSSVFELECEHAIGARRVLV